MTKTKSRSFFFSPLLLDRCPYYDRRFLLFLLVYTTTHDTIKIYHIVDILRTERQMSSSHQPARRGQQQLDARFSPDGGRVGRFALFLFPYVCGTVLERAPITKWTDEVGTIGRRRQQRLYFLLFLSLFLFSSSSC